MRDPLYNRDVCWWQRRWWELLLWRVIWPPWIWLVRRGWWVADEGALLTSGRAIGWSPLRFE